MTIDSIQGTGRYGRHGRLGLHALALAVCATLAACGGNSDPAASDTTATAVPSDTTGSANLLQVSTEQREANGLAIEAAAPALMEQRLQTYGSVALPVASQSRVGARYPGMVREVFKSAGDEVKAGDALLSVESNESLRRYTVTAPIDGIVLERHVGPGETVADGTLFVIADIRHLQVKIAVFNADRPKVRAGQPVYLQAPGQTDAAQAATIHHITPSTDAMQQQVIAYVPLDNSDDRWSPGQFVEAGIVIGTRQAAVSVPSSAVQQFDGRTVVFVAHPDGFTAEDVDIGLDDGQRVEILSGLNAGDRVAVGNTFVLRSELQTREEE